MVENYKVVESSDSVMLYFLSCQIILSGSSSLEWGLKIFMNAFKLLDPENYLKYRHASAFKTSMTLKIDLKYRHASAQDIILTIDQFSNQHGCMF